MKIRPVEDELFRADEQEDRRTDISKLIVVIRNLAKAPYIYIYIYIYRVSQEEWTKLRESVPYVELYRYNPKHIYPKLNGYGDNGQRSLKL